MVQVTLERKSKKSVETGSSMLKKTLEKLAKQCTGEFPIADDDEELDNNANLDSDMDD